MSTENDVPLGEESRRHYEQQFGDRIQRINKGGKAPQRDSGSSSWNGRAGCGGILAVIFIIRLIAVLFHSHSSTPSYNYTPPPQPQFKVGMPQGNDRKVQDKEVDRILERLDKAVRQRGVKNLPDFGAADENVRDPQVLLTEADVPLLEGLCYRIYQESLRPKSTPGGHLMKLLRAAPRDLLVKMAKGRKLDGEERDAILEGLNDVLQQPTDLLQEGFVKLPAVKQFVEARELLILQESDRRRILELCYPRQIVPLRARSPRCPSAQKWLRRAQIDLEEARWEYEPEKR